MAQLSRELEIHVRGCIENKRKSQEWLHRKYYQALLPVCMRYTRNVDQAEDILQNSFIKIFDKIGNYKFEGSFEGWMKRIVVNTAIDYHRGRKNDFILENEEDGMEKYDRPDENEDEWNFPYSPQQVMAAIQELTPAYQAVFNLYVIEDYSHKEIAEILNVSIGTSKSNLLKAKSKLKKILENNYEKDIA